MDILPQKRCTKCGETKPLTEFDKRNTAPCGYKSACKACRRVEVQATDATRLAPDAVKVCRKCKMEKPAKDFDVNIKVSSGYYSTCRECRRAGARAWKARNKDRIREYEAENYDHLLQLRYAWQERNRETSLARRRIRSYTPKERLYNRLRSHQRRVAKNGTVTPEQVRELEQRQKKCYYCLKPFTDKLKATIDHVIPINKGGLHDISNLVLACKSCNSSKSDRLLRLI